MYRVMTRPVSGFLVVLNVDFFIHKFNNVHACPLTQSASERLRTHNL